MWAIITSVSNAPNKQILDKHNIKQLLLYRSICIKVEKNVYTYVSVQKTPLLV